jgi:hypothetical protein
MAGLVPAIHVSLVERAKTWMPGIRPGMTIGEMSGHDEDVIAIGVYQERVDPYFVDAPYEGDFRCGL